MKKRGKSVTEEFNLAPSSAHIVLGVNDQNLVSISERTNTKIRRRGSKVLIEGVDQDVELAQACLTQLTRLAERGMSVGEAEIVRCLIALSNDMYQDYSETLDEKIEIQSAKRWVYPKTPAQTRFIGAMRSKRIVFGVGPAGTGKSYLSVAMAVSKLLKKEVKKIILCRPAIEAGEKLGFLPGTIEEKIDPYMRPLFDALFDLLEPEKLNELLSRGQIEVAPLAFMRGRTLANSFVVLDEAQNTTCLQMKMFLTRIGQGSTFVINGDLTQIDLPKSEYPGLLDAINRLSEIKSMSIVQFTENDVVRDPLVSEILKAYEKDSY
ncbi:MAG: PhoH family protein [Thermoplasmatales archaeon]